MDKRFTRVFYQGFAVKSHKREAPQTLFGRVKHALWGFLEVYFFVLLIRLFVIEAYRIPSESMSPTLLVGDTLMVEKLSFGAFVPLWNRRILGFLEPQRNDIVTFLTPDWRSPGKWAELVTWLSLSVINLDNTFDNPKNLVKRVVGIPGDTLAFTNRVLYVNGQAMQNQSLGSLDMTGYRRGRPQALLRMDLYTETGAGATRVVQYLDAWSNRVTNMQGFGDYGFLTNRRLLVSGFPKIIVPRKGQTIEFANVSLYALSLYRKMISREVGEELQLGYGHSLLWRDQSLTRWTFQSDYYFLMGDNRDMSEDGRYFGLVPRSSIYGRVLFRYWPLNRLRILPNYTAEEFRRR